MNDQFSTRQQVSLGSLFDDYVLFLFANGRRDQTIKSHKSSFKRYSQVFKPEMSPEEINFESFIKYRTWLIKNPNYTTETKKDTEKDLKAFFNYLRNYKNFFPKDFFKILPKLSEVLDHQLQEKIQLSKPRRTECLTEEQANLISMYSFAVGGYGDLYSQKEHERLNYFYNKQNQLIIKMLLGLGFRIGELLNLKVSRIFQEQVLNPSTEKYEDALKISFERYKTRTHETLFAVKNLKKLLEEFIALRFKFGVQCDYLFVGRKQSHEEKFKKIYPTYIKRLIQRLNKISEVKFSAHTLRHTFGNQFVSKGGNLRDLQMILGHARITTTERYSHAEKESKLRGIFFVSN